MDARIMDASEPTAPKITHPYIFYGLTKREQPVVDLVDLFSLCEACDFCVVIA